MSVPDEHLNLGRQPEIAVISPKKLIEVALPLDAINAACVREKALRHGHPSTLHLWWARRPLAAARAVIFAQLVHDPEDLWRCQNPGVQPNPQQKGGFTKSRNRLFRLIEKLVQWENTNNEIVLNEAREEIRQAWQQTCDLNKNHPEAKELFPPGTMPCLHDPFAGGGSIPLEAQRLGLHACASDLNPVAVLINKAMIEIPPKFAGRSPVNPEVRKDQRLFAKRWKGAEGLAEDVRYYGQWMRDEAVKRIGQLYPSVEVTADMARARPDLKPYVGQSLTVIAWLWARTVKSPNPAFSHVDVPLVSSFMLSTGEGKEAYIDPAIKGDTYEFRVRVGKPKDKEAAKNGTKASKQGADFLCIVSNTPINGNYIKQEAQAGRIGQRLMAVVTEGRRGRVYLSPDSANEEIAKQARPTWKPQVEFFDKALGFRVGNYGMHKWCDLFTDRQLVTLGTFSQLVGEARELIKNDTLSGAISHNFVSNGDWTMCYADALSCYLAFAVSRTADYGSMICSWHNGPKMQALRNTFGRSVLPMVWDFAEGNPFSESSGNWLNNVEWVAKALTQVPARGSSHVEQADATVQKLSRRAVVSTDPPYYDNIGYADLSDFFYVWLRHSLQPAFPTLLCTIATPKTNELVATPHRHGTKGDAESFFVTGMTLAMRNIAEQASPTSPITIYYAFKQSETEGNATNSMGWETFLAAVLRAGLAITGTWPMRTELGNRMRGLSSNALASSVVLVCRPRAKNAGIISRRQFVRMLNETLPPALDAMTRRIEGEHSPVAPVDLSQAIIGPGMAIFSRYDSVLEADGSPMTVKAALQLINRFLAEDDFDADTQFCLQWFEQQGWSAGKFGEADVLARAKGTSVDGVKLAGVVESGGGNVRLLRSKEYDTDWNPSTAPRLSIWEALHRLIGAYSATGEAGAAHLLASVASKAEAARQLAYRLYTLCERNGWAEDARAYNEIVTGWSAIESEAQKFTVDQLHLPFHN